MLVLGQCLIGEYADMIIIKNIEFLETDKDIYEIYQQDHRSNFFKVGDDFVERKIFTELIRGRRFRRPSDGTDIIIGVSKQAQDVIGLQYEAFTNLEQMYNLECHNHSVTAREKNKYFSKLEVLRTASFFTRIKWLFKGIQ